MTLLLLSEVNAQETIFSNIRGVVTDQSGSVLLGVKVDLLNQGTNVSRSATSGDDGGYRFDAIVSGLYTITVEAPGFKRYVLSDIDLKNSKTIQVDPVLEVGSVTDTVTVTAQATAIETQAPTISVSLTKGFLNTVPAGGGSNYRILQTFYNFAPGGNSGNYNGTAALNGMPNTGFAERSTIDGIRVLSTCCQTTPATETLDEMKMITHNAGAEYATPTTMQLTTKQGGSEFHGQVWWLYADKALDARDTFSAGKLLQHSNSLGGGVGGPIVKEKVFFFFSAEGVRLNNTITTDRPVVSANLPTAEMQQGNFSQLLDPTFVNTYNRGTFVTVRDPITGQPFPNNMIPAAAQSSVSQNFINKFWTTPQLPGLVANQFLQAIRPNRRDKWDLRGDYNITDKHRLMARYGWSIYVGAIPTTALTQETANNGTLTFRSHNAGISETYVISPSMTNEIKYGVSIMPTQGSSFDFQTQDIMGEVGMQGTDGLVGLPGIAISGFSGWSASAAGNTAYNTQTLADSLSVAHGKHFLKFGVQFNYESVNFTTATTPPTFTFDGRLSGFSWADFMLGLPAATTRTVAPGPFHYIAKDWGFFAQDEIRVTRNLNLSLGLRYQIWPYSYEANNLLSVFDPGRGAVIVPDGEAKNKVVATFPSQRIPVLTAAEANYPAQNRSLTNTDFGAWAPRLGFAWQPFEGRNTVIRGGYGIFYWNSRTGGPAAAGSVFTGSQTLTQQLGSNGTLVPTMQFPNPFTAFTSGPIQTLDPVTLNFTAADPSLRLPYVQNWNLTVEQDIRGQATVRVSYMGSGERRNQFGFNINEAAPGRLAFDQSRRPYPLVRDINYVHNGGSPRSNMLQVVVDKPMKHGLQLNAAFTWMHKLTDIAAIGPGAAFGLSRFTADPSFVTPRRQFILTYLWDVPVGRGRQYHSNLSPVAEGILGGWRIIGVTKFETGQYFTPTYTGVNPAGTTPGTGVQIPDRIGNGNFDRSTRAANAPDKPYFDTSAFQCPGGSSINGLANLLSAGCPQSTPQNVGRFGNSAINTIEGPGVNGWIVSVAKQFRLGSETRLLELSGNITNPFNHPNWAPPATDLSSPAGVALITRTSQLGIDPYSLSRRRILLQAKLIF